MSVPGKGEAVGRRETAEHRDRLPGEGDGLYVLYVRAPFRSPKPSQPGSIDFHMFPELKEHLRGVGSPRKRN